MLCATGWRRLSGAMYATRLYGNAGGGGAKPGRRAEPAMMEGPPPQTQAYPLYRADTHRAHTHYHYAHTHMAPPQPPAMHTHTHYQRMHTLTHNTHRASWTDTQATATHHSSKKKTWNFIHEKMSYDTFFTMKRLIERSRSPDEVLRWVTQNPSKVSHNHYPVALQKIGQLLQGPGPAQTDSEASGSETGRLILEQPDFHSLCSAIVSDCNKFDNFSIVNCLYAVAALGLPSDSPVVTVLEAESQSRLHQFNQKDLSMVFSSCVKLHPASHQPLTDAKLHPASHQPLTDAKLHPASHQLLTDAKLHPEVKLNPASTEAKPNQASPHTLTETKLNTQTDAKLHLASTEAKLHLASTEAKLHPASTEAKLHPASQHALTEACVCALERNLERERHPQTLFNLLSYYRTKLTLLQQANEATANSTTPSPEQLLANRKVLRLVKHTLQCVSSVRDQEMVLLDLMLAACVREASNKSLELIFSSHLFYQNRQEAFISSLAEELPNKADSITPYTMALIAKYIARHRLRETRLLDTIAEYLVKKAEYLDSKVIQKLVFPFSRMNYRPSNQLFFCRLEGVLELKALSSPLATVNILMSLFQLGQFPGPVLHRVFSQAFINNVTNSPYALIVRRYLSLLDAAVELEYEDYSGPRLHHAHKVLMFDHALTADEVNRKYSYKGLVAEALRQLVGEHNYKQDQVLAPGYYTDFVLCTDVSGRVLPIRPSVSLTTKPADDAAVAAVTSEFQKFNPFTADEAETANGASAASYSAYAAFYPPGLTKEASVESQDSSSLSSPPSDQKGEGPDCREPMGFYQDVTSSYPEATPPSDQTHTQPIRRLIMSVNDKWHYCHNSDVLVGSRAMRDRHLRLLGFIIVQLPYHELEKLNGIEEVKQYLHKKLLDAPL